jgi:hypothetical protein
MSEKPNDKTKRILIVVGALVAIIVLGVIHMRNQ